MMSNAPAGAGTPYAESYEILEFGPFRFAPASNGLSRDGVDVHLTPKPAAVLGVLLHRAGELVKKEEFLHEVWSSVNVREESLTQAISTVRLALGDQPQSPRFIQTISGEGYRFIGPVVAREAALVRAVSDRSRTEERVRREAARAQDDGLFAGARGSGNERDRAPDVSLRERLRWLLSSTLLGSVVATLAIGAAVAV